MTVQANSFEVTKDHALPIAPLGGSLKLTNASGDTLYYSDSPSVSALVSLGALTAGQSVTFTNPAWVISASLTTVTTLDTFSTSATPVPVSGVNLLGAAGTNLGAAQTVDFQGLQQEVWLVGTLNANLTVTVANRVAGCRALLVLTQDGTGSRTLTVSDGVTGQPVTITPTPAAVSAVEVKCPDAATVDVVVGAASGDASGTLGNLTVNTVQGGKTPRVFVAASGDTTGVADTANINAALVSPGRATLIPGQTYYVSPASGASVTLPTNSVLDCRGATINQVTYNVPVLQNSKAVARNTATDCSCTINSTTLTSPTLAGVAQTGDIISFQGAGNNGSQALHGCWYGIVNSIAGNNLTMSTTSYSAVASGGTASLYRGRDTNIQVEGGTWNVVAPPTTSSSRTAFLLRRIDGLRFGGDMVVNSPGAGTDYGGDFVVTASDVTNVDIGDIYLPPSSNNNVGCGVFIGGPASNVTVHDIYGYTIDNMVTAQTMNGQISSVAGYDGTDTQGTITNLTIEHIYPVLAPGGQNGPPVLLFDCDTVYFQFAFKGVTIRDVKGSYGAGAALVQLGTGASGSYMLGVTVGDVECNGSPAGGAAVQIGENNTRDVTIDGVAWNTTTTPTAGIVNIAKIPATCRIRNVSMATTAAVAGTSIGVKCVSSPVTNTDLVIESVRVTPDPTTFIPLQLNGGTMRRVTLRSVEMSASSGTLVQFNAATTISGALHLEDIVVMSAAAGVTIPTAQAACTIHASNVYFAGTNFVTSLSPFTLKAVNLDVNTTGAVIALTTANSTPVNLWYVNYAQAGAGADTSKDGTQVITLNKANYTTTTP